MAKVGDEVITVKDFRYNYELGLPLLKSGPDPKRTYLLYMIKEKTLAAQGKKMGLEKSERVIQLEKELLDELLVEQLFEKEVNEKIKITPEEIKDAIAKSAVKWKLRYWAEPNEEFANSICQAMRQRGYSDVVAEILKNNPEVNLQAKDFDTDFLSWLDISPELLEAIKDLPIGEISNPIELNGAYFIFQIVDIRREPLTDYDFGVKAESYKKILFYRQSLEKAKKFVSDYMAPKNVVTKGSSFRKLASALLEWDEKYKKSNKSFLEAIQSAKAEDKALLSLKNSLEETLVTFENQKWSLDDFIHQYNAKAIKFPSEGGKNFKSVLNQHIALKVRNYFFIKEAKGRKLDKSPAVQKELNQWREKWIYEEARELYTASVKVTEEQASLYFEKNKDKYKIRWDDEPKFKDFINQAKRDAAIQNAKNILNRKIDSLAVYFPVKINHQVLDTIEVIDAKKSRWLSLQAFKRSSNRMIVPIVDPAWGW